MVLHEKQIDFDLYEVDLRNKSEEFLSISPYGKVPVLVVEGTCLYESNVVNEYLEEVYEAPRLMPKDPEGRASARSWMSFADEYFFPAIFGVRSGSQRGFSAEQLREASEKLRDPLSRLEQRLEDRQYLVEEYTLADIAHAGNFHRLRELAQREDISLKQHPNVSAWMERMESRKSYKASP